MSMDGWGGQLLKSSPRLDVCESRTWREDQTTDFLLSLSLWRSGRRLLAAVRGNLSPGLRCCPWALNGGISEAAEAAEGGGGIRGSRRKWFSPQWPALPEIVNG